MTTPTPDVGGLLDPAGLIMAASFAVRSVLGFRDEGPGVPAVAVTVTGHIGRDQTPTEVMFLLPPEAVCDLADAIEAAAIATIPPGGSS
jgi:hypothetical protein